MPAFPGWRRARGNTFEGHALRYLRRQGLRLVSRNYHCRLGEIDLVLLDGDTLVFAEVRYRGDRRFGGAAVTVDWQKQRKLLRAAKHFLLAHRQYQHRDCRFDVLAIETDPAGKHQVEWIRHAFY